MDHAQPQPKLLDLVRAVIRSKHYSRRTEETYIGWITRYVRFHKTRHPRELGSEAITAFLTHLAVDLDVAASTQNQARSALLFLYREVLHRDLTPLGDLPRAQRPRRQPGTTTSPPYQRLQVASSCGSRNTVSDLS